jgi:single-stranded DNA-specific DHH superfamily exonuclease
MPPLPNIPDPDRHKPLCYDPTRQRFITYDDILQGKEPIIRPQTLTHEQRKKLIIQRNKVGPDYQIRSLNGEIFTRDDIIQAIEQETDFGRMSMNAEVSMLSDLLEEIQKAIDES